MRHLPIIFVVSLALTVSACAKKHESPAEIQTEQMAAGSAAKADAAADAAEGAADDAAATAKKAAKDASN